MLFDEQQPAPSNTSSALRPLAERMRPKTLDEMVGQTHIIGEGKPLRTMIERDVLASLVFHGPPGTGKSTLAKIIVSRTKSAYIHLNAVLSNVKELRDAIKKGEANLRRGVKTILFLDEIHRFNKQQQDALLPALEDGSIVLIGSTTHNPTFYLTNALLSRVMLFSFKEIANEDILRHLKRALTDNEGCLGENVRVTDDALAAIVSAALGDIRKALTTLEFAHLAAEMTEGEDTRVTCNIVKEVVQKKGLRYDGTGDEHYDVISAFIKSVRGSDPDAAVYYLALMLESGEDPRFIARRLAILAAEDIGLADPDALSVAASTFTLIDFVGMPEAMLILSECAIYLALAPKSNSAYLAINKAMKDVKEGEVFPVPNYLRDARSSFFDKREPEGYRYAHDAPYHVVAQEYLTKRKRYYDAGDLGKEKEMKRRLAWIRKHIYGEGEDTPQA